MTTPTLALPSIKSSKLKASEVSNVSLWNCNCSAVYNPTWSDSGFVAGLYRGLAITLWRDVPYSGFYLYLYESLKASPFGQYARSSSPSLQHLSCGLAAGTLASLVTQPLDVVKTHVQVSNSTKPLSVIKATLDFTKAHGVGGLFRGATPRVLRRAMVAALSWTLYEHVC